MYRAEEKIKELLKKEEERLYKNQWISVTEFNNQEYLVNELKSVLRLIKAYQDFKKI